MTNHLASAIRRIMDHYDADPLEGDRYVAELADRVEAVAAEPDVHELAAAGLDPEQEIRADALAEARAMPPGLAMQVLRRAGRLEPGAGPDDTDVLDLADVLAAYIRDGSRPGQARRFGPDVPCTCPPGGGSVIVGALAPNPVGTMFGVLGLTLVLFGVARIRAEDHHG